MKDSKQLLTCVASMALLFVATAWGGEHKEYPVTLKVLETDAISSKSDGTKITTSCTSTGPNDVTCDSTAVSAAQHTELVSLANASDGKLYMISCVLGTGRRFLSGMGQSMQANAGLATVGGCAVPPGTYKARWDKGRRLKVLNESNGKSKETTFVVLSSVAVPTGKTARAEDVSNGEKTVLNLSSTPLSADIGLDGSFVGQTPSSVFALPGDHYIKIMKTGYKPWERTIRASGGEVTVCAELDPQEK